MPSKQKKWRRLKELKKRKKKLQQEGNRQSDKEKERGPTAKKKVRRKGPTTGSLTNSKAACSGWKGALKKTQQPNTSQQQQTAAIIQPLMSLSGGDSAGPDLSGSGGGRDSTRSMNGRDLPKGKSSHKFSHWGNREDSHFDRNVGHMGGVEQSDWAFGSGLYTPFDQEWPDPRMPGPTFSSDRWNGPSHKNRFQDPWDDIGPGLNGRQGPGLMPPPSGYHRQPWNREHFAWNRNRLDADRDSLSSNNGSTRGSHNKRNWDQDGNKGSRWNRFTRQFQDNHFHREDGPGQDASLQGEEAAGDGHQSLASSQADSSGLDESSGSTGRKRSHSTEEEKRLSKSSRGESSGSVGASSTVTSSSALGGRSKAVFDLKGSSSTQKPDSTSVKVKSHSSGDISRRLMSHPAAVTTTKPNGPAVKKKQFAESAKNLAAGVHPKSAGGSVPGGEGVLEKAERICKELREKRKQAAQKQAAAVSSRPAEMMNKSLDDSVHSLQSTQSSCFKGYLSDSNVPASSGSSTSGATQASGRASPASSHFSDVERIRHSIESSVLAEGRSAHRQHAAFDAVSRSLRVGGARTGGSVPFRRLSTPSSATAVAAPSSTSTTNKPPRPQALSKEALARMVNSPHSRAQRVQLARMLRLHTNTSATRPRHTRLNLQIDGNNDDTGDNSVEDVLKDLGGLQELECLGELRNVKLEDLTTEDKLRIAQMIEDADRNSSSCDMDRDQGISAEVSASGLTSLNGQSSKSSRTQNIDISKRQAQPDTSSNIAVVDVMEIDSPSPQKARLVSPQRMRTPSPNPNRPLSIDDLSVAMSTEKNPVPAAKSPVRVLCSPIRPSSADMPSVSDTVHADVLGVKERAVTPVDDTADHTGDVHQSSPLSRSREITSVVCRSREVTSVAGEMHVAGGDLHSEHEAEEQSHQHFEDTAETINTSDVLSPLNSMLSMQAGSTASSGGISRQAGILHEVLGLCQRQDSVLSEMRGIDVQLSQLYKSLIEIVARMSSLQRRRVQLQGEGEQLSQQRNSLLAGIIPGSSTLNNRDHHPAGQTRQPYSSASATLTSFTAPATVTSMSLSRDVYPPVRGSSSQGEMVPSSLGSAVILPSWLTTAGTSQLIGDRRGQNTVVPIHAESTHGSDVCLSGSVSSSVHSETPAEPQQESFMFDGFFNSGNYISVRSGSREQVPLSNVNTQHSGSMISQVTVSASPFGPSSTKPSSSREPRAMLSLGDTDSNAASNKSASADVGTLHVSERSTDLTVSSISVNSSNTVSAGRQPRDTHLMESSSGIGSSIVTGISSSSLTQQNHDSSGQSDLSTVHADSDQGSITSVWDARHSAQQDSSSKVTATSKSIFSFTSPQPGSSGVRSQTQSSPGVSVSYIGSISSSTTSDLVQQIVRNLPITSQLGEVGSPRSMSMYLLKSTGAENRSPSVDAASRERSTSDPADISSSKTRTRTTSLNDVSIVSDLGFQNKSTGVGLSSQKSPTGLTRLDLSVSEDAGQPKVGTPHSESDGSSVVSSASLGEQIKFMSERNGTTAVGATHSFARPDDDDDIELIEDGDEMNNTPDSSVRGCSVVLQRLNLENSMTSEFFKKPKETEKPKKKMKTKKDRNKVLQNRRHFFVDSSSEDHASAAYDDSLPDLDRVPMPDLDFIPLLRASTGTANSIDDHLQKGANRICASRSGDNVLIAGETEDLDLTLVGEEDMQVIYDDDTEENRPATSSGISSSHMRMKAVKQKVFRADQDQNLNPPSSPCVVSSDSGTQTIEPQNPSASQRKKKIFSVCGPSAPVMGLEVYREQLYVCFLRYGVHSYSLRDAQLIAVYPMESALCFVVRPTCLAVGCEDRLAFVSLNSGGRKILGSIDTEVKVMCLLATETKLFAGLDCGAVIVASFRTLQVTQRFQASDSAIHCMAWTREGSTRLLCVSDQNANIHVLDAGSGLPVRSLTGHTKTSFALCMMDHHLISGSGDRSVMAHDVHTAEIVWKLQDHKGLVTSICVDNGLLFSTGYDRVIRCYDLKSRRLLRLLYGAGKNVVMRMAIHNSVLYSGNREGQIEAVDLRDMSSFTCGCDSCGMVFGLKKHLQHHLITDHYRSTNSCATPCPWRGCLSVIQPEIFYEHLRSHAESK